MKATSWAIGLVLASAAAFVAAGCSPADKKGAPAKQGTQKQTAQAEKKGGAAKAPDDADTWWCKEHGVPEQVCGLCDAKHAAKAKSEGDWCKEHERPESQCFICHPDYESKFVAMYQDRYGKKPPEREKEEAELKKDAKGEKK